MYVRTYTCTYHGMYTYTYHGTPWYNVRSQLSDWKRAHMCTENHVCFGMYVRTMVRTYTCTNITLSQKRLEIQALRYVLEYHGTMVRTHVRTRVQHYQWYLKNDLKYKHSGATAIASGRTMVRTRARTLVRTKGYYCNSTRVPRYSSTYQWYHGTYTSTIIHVDHGRYLVPWY